jgi:hypothetical protein
VIEGKPARSERNSNKPPFLPILFYVLGFMLALAALAWLVALILRNLH